MKRKIILRGGTETELTTLSFIDRHWNVRSNQELHRHHSRNGHNNQMSSIFRVSQSYCECFLPPLLHPLLPLSERFPRAPRHYLPTPNTTSQAAFPLLLTYAATS